MKKTINPLLAIPIGIVTIFSGLFIVLLGAGLIVGPASIEITKNE